MSVTGPALTASFVYDGDGRRVKSTIKSIQPPLWARITKLREPQPRSIISRARKGLRCAQALHSPIYSLIISTSTSITTNSSGALVSELRYKPWGEGPYSSGTTSTKYQYTGQYSHTADFGLMFYNARWYDPALGRFAQADFIVPPVGVLGLDRYAYANNSPLVYTDPSGHESVCGSIYSDPECNGEPDHFMNLLLRTKPERRTGVSGMDYYNWYKDFWYKQNSSFTVWDFIALIIYVELDNVGNPAIPNMYAGYESYREGRCGRPISGVKSRCVMQAHLKEH